jgi:hypothetical protein
VTTIFLGTGTRVVARVNSAEVYSRLDGPAVPPLPAGNTVLLAAAAAEREINRLKPLAKSAGPDTKAALVAKLTDAQAKYKALQRLAHALPENEIVGKTILGAQIVGGAAAILMLVFGHHDVGMLHNILDGGIDIGLLGIAANIIRSTMGDEIAQRFASFHPKAT